MIVMDDARVLPDYPQASVLIVKRLFDDTYDVCLFLFPPESRGRQIKQLRRRFA